MNIFKNKILVIRYLLYEDVARFIVIAISTSSFLLSLFWMLLIYLLIYLPNVQMQLQ